MYRQPSIFDRAAAFFVIAFMAFPDMLATASVLATQPWTQPLEINATGNVALATDRPSNHNLPISATHSAPTRSEEAMRIKFEDSHTAYLGGHSLDALNKPSDDVFSFVLTGSQLENVEISFKTDAKEVGLTINGQQFIKAQDGNVILANEILRNGTNTVLFTSLEDQPIEVGKVNFRAAEKSAASETVLQAANTDDFTTEASALNFRLDRSQTAAIPISLSNVTRGATAYRSAETDQPTITVRVGVSRTISESRLREARVMFFDYETKSWQQAFVKEVDHANYMLEAEVPGGTDYFAAMIKTPEMPEASAFMPTAISDLEPKTPAEGITLIQPPTANQQGDANISYPLNIPQGRQGMTPQLSLNYSSSGGESWCGYGWSLPLQSISVDTRWGVPTFDPTTQSEVYLLDGQSLHEQGGKKANRPEVTTSVMYPNRESGKRQFFPKQQSTNTEIIRRGSAADNYYWVVTGPDGTSNFYGCSDTSSIDGGSVLATKDGNITRWYLKKTQDRFGNNIIYTYDTIPHPGTVNLKGHGKTMYLKKIEYTGFNATAGKYSIEFVVNTGRLDTRISYNSGVKEVDELLLKKIEVRYDGQLVKDFRLDIDTGDFNKQILHSIGEYHDGQLFYEHTFTYHSVGTTVFEQNPKRIKLSSIPTMPTLFDDIPFMALQNKLQAAVMPSFLKTSVTQGWSVGGALGIGVSPENTPNQKGSKLWTLSGKLNYSQSSTHDRFTFQDVNGDGLSDLIITGAANGSYSYRPLIVSGNQVSFGARRSLPGSKLYQSSSHSINTGVDYSIPYGVFTAGLNWNYSTNKVKQYLLDYNGDGVLDRVVTTSNGSQQVEFGVLNSSGILWFEDNSQNTLNPVLKKSSLQAYHDDALKSFEVVKTWKAPVNGMIEIISDPSFSLGVTGSVTVSIQHDDNFLQPPTSIPSNNGYYSATEYVQKGDILLFRMSPESDGQQDFISWDPEVSYTSALPADGNFSNYTSSSYSESFVLSGGEGIALDQQHQIKVNLNRDGFDFSDDIYYRIIIEATDTTDPTAATTSQVFVDRLDQTATTFGAFTAPFIGAYSAVPNLGPNDICQLHFEVFSHSNVDWTKTSWRPDIEIKTDCDDNPIKFYPNVEYGMYNSVRTLLGPTSLSLASGQYEINPDINENKAAIDAIFSGVLNQNVDQTVYFVVKSGGRTLSKKAILIHKDQDPQQNSLTLYTIDQASGVPDQLVLPTNFSGSNTAVFNGNDVAGNSVTLEYFAESSPYALAALNYIWTHLGSTYVIEAGQGITNTLSSTTNKNMFFGSSDVLNSRWLGWGQFAWSADPQTAILSSDLKIPGTDNLDPEAGPVESMTNEEMEGVNPLDNSFFMLNPTRGDNAIGLWSYEHQILGGIAAKDHYSVFGSHLGCYRSDSAMAVGYFGEEQLEVSGQVASSSLYAAAAAMQVNKSSSLAGNIGIGQTPAYTQAHPSQMTFRLSMSSTLQPLAYGSNAASMFQDFNGDGYPDLILQDGPDVKMQLTNGTGGHTGSFVALTGEKNSLGHSNGGGLMVSGNYKNEDQRFTTSGNASIGVNVGTTFQEIEYEDVNGDGLLDRVYDDLDKVALNNGRGFDGLRGWTIDPISINQSTVAPPSLSAALQDAVQGLSFRISNDAESFTAGIGVNTSGSRAKSVGIDVNGDGLVDIIDDEGQKIYINTGTTYLLWKNSSNQNVDLSAPTELAQSQNFGITGDVGGTLNAYPFSFIKVSLSGNGGLNYAVNKTRSTFMDINGDGAVDFVVSDENGDLLVYYSKMTRSNYLTKVENPLGGSFEIDYKLVGHKRGSYAAEVLTHRSNERMLWDMPSGKWVMSKVTINDGLEFVDDSGLDLDGDDQTMMFFNYDGGIQNRREKEFMGFTRVETRQQNQLGDENTFPKKYLTEVVEYFAPSDLYFNDLKKQSYQKGLVHSTFSLLHHQANATSDTVKLISAQNSTYQYRLVDISSANKGKVQKTGSSWDLVNWSSISEAQTVFPAVIATEALNIPQLANPKYHSQLFELDYDEYFNVVRYQDKADMTPNGISEQVIETLVTVNKLEYVQKNSCLDLPVPFIDNGSVIGYDIPADPSHSGYANDTLWLMDFTGNCPADDIFGMDLCAVADTDTYYTHHYKDTVVYTQVYKTITTATYASDRIAVMEYFAPNDAAGRTNVLKKHSIYVGSVLPNNMVRQSKVSALTPNKLSVKTMQTTLNAAGDLAQTDLSYDGYGNVLTVTGAENLNSQRAVTNYTYDNVLSQFVVGISNQFGESVCNLYDLPTGLLKQTVGINGQPMVYEYDQYNRLKNVWAPKEIIDPDGRPTISYSYIPRSMDTNGHITYPAAITTHNLGTTNAFADPSVSYSPFDCAEINLSGRLEISNGVRTATIVDGLGRAAQIQKEQSSGALLVGNYVASGPQTLDKFGRTSQSYADVLSASDFGKLFIDQSYHYNPAEDLVQRNITYDYFNRPISSENWTAENTTQGQWTTTEMQYGWNQDFQGVDHYFEKTSILSDSGTGTLTPNTVVATFTDARGRKIAQISYGATTADDILTQFEYNEIGELTLVTDPLGEQTAYTYDLAGRVLTEDHSDRGLTTTTYDKASNVMEISTPATQSFGGSITMNYDFNRLVSRLMPNSSGMDLYDIQYTYGYKGDGRNGAGRVVKVEQGQTFKIDDLRYDELGQSAEEVVSIDVPMQGGRMFTTRKFYDSFGRILQAGYPDGDKVDYQYNALGELSGINSILGGVTQPIITAISYNGYGQISLLTYGNGTSTTYSYASGNTKKATTLMSSAVTGKEQGGVSPTTLLSRQYAYNKQGMVAAMDRSIAGSLLSQSSVVNYHDSYSYDAFGRLEGHHQLNGTTPQYDLTMSYNKAGGITFKDGNGNGFMNAQSLNYNLEYGYSPAKPHQLEQIWDADNAITTQFQYNTSGSITQIDDPSQGIPQEFYWNEAQQLTGVKNQQGVHHYIYDHQGERIMKSSLITSTVYLNDQVIDDVNNLDPYTVYVNPFYVVTGFMGGDRVSKHYYMNQQRVATDISINYDPNGNGGAEAQGASPRANAQNLALVDLLKVLRALEQPELDTTALTLPRMESVYPELQPSSTTSTALTENITNRILFWYHPDYLGNVDLVTEKDGYAYEFFVYTPWGEEMHQWNANTFNFSSPYRFNGKELDPETGLAYYGARYYQNKIG
ncbi:MAG: SpvB/TcaC N-terminal domain-containing protein, partial [Bacteroidetes bacterium]|nr:SpvB/TcaC N-terminal domain-containing protein [Bacteroidota bacterium]